MKHKALTLTVAVVLACTALLLAESPSEKGNSPVGTWKLISTKYGDATAFSDYPTDHQRVKMITPTHFTWVEYESGTKKVSTSAGGRYTFRSGVYTETIDFVGDGMVPFLGKTHEFKITIQGDKCFQSGQLANGLKIEEVWQRMQ
jgi:hypothetical protein